MKSQAGQGTRRPRGAAARWAVLPLAFALVLLFAAGSVGLTGCAWTTSSGSTGPETTAVGSSTSVSSTIGVSTSGSTTVSETTPPVHAITVPSVSSTKRPILPTSTSSVAVSSSNPELPLVLNSPLDDTPQIFMNTYYGAIGASAPTPQNPKGIHMGIDLVAPKGTPIKAVASGVISNLTTETKTEPDGTVNTYANLLQVIDSHDTVNYIFEPCQSMLVTKGQKVNSGDVLGTLADNRGQNMRARDGDRHARSRAPFGCRGQLGSGLLHSLHQFFFQASIGDMVLPRLHGYCGAPRAMRVSLSIIHNHLPPCSRKAR